jgi:hypothetical protein
VAEIHTTLDGSGRAYLDGRRAGVEVTASAASGLPRALLDAAQRT